MQSSSGTRRSVRSFILDTTCIPWSTYLRCNGFLIRSSTIFKDIKVQKRNDPQAHQNREPIRHQAARWRLPLIHVRQALKCFDSRLVSRSAIARSLKSPITEKKVSHTERKNKYASYLDFGRCGKICRVIYYPFGYYYSITITCGCRRHALGASTEHVTTLARARNEECYPNARRVKNL